MNTLPNIILASGSRYRRELLERLGVAFEAWSPDVDESSLTGEKPRDTAVRLARSKAEPSTPTPLMLYYAVVFLIIAILAGILGFGSLSGLAATIAKVLVVVFLVLFVLSLLKRKK